MYWIDSYPTPAGERDVLLVELPSDRHVLALVDVPAVPAPLDHANVCIVERSIDRLNDAAVIARDHIERSLVAGRPATGASLLADIAAIANYQAIRASAPAHAA